MPTPLVSVVLSVYNGELFLEEALESILGQRFRDLELIVINDGSTDQTASLLAACQSRDRRIRVYDQPNRGLVASLNRGCELARGKYIARMDADDIATPDRLTRQVAFMEDHPDIGLLGGAVNIVDSTGRVLLTSCNPTADHEIRAALLCENTFWHSTVMMQRQVFAAAGGYRKVVVDAEDYDLWLRVADHWALANVEEVVLKYRLHPHQVTVRRCKNVALSSLAARAAAAARRRGDPDPLSRVQEITPVVLAELGVDEAAQQDAVAHRFLWGIRSMYITHQYSAALDALVEMLNTSDWESATRRVVADLRLLRAQLYWHERRFAKSILSAGHAIVTRPAMIGRPLRSLLRRDWHRRAGAQGPRVS